MTSSDPHGLGYRDVDVDSHTEVLVSNMEATAEWSATKRLRAWERQQLRLGDGERLLDVGCGRGDAAISLADDLGPDGALVGIDASAAMIDVARRLGEESACSVRFSVGDARSLSEPDETFDVVRSERTLQWLQEPGRTVEECVRVLKRGGRLSLLDTDWSSLDVSVGNDEITRVVREGLSVERNRPSNVGRRLTVLAQDAGCQVTAHTIDTQRWNRWDPDDSPAPDGCFSMTSLADDLVEAGHLGSGAARQFVDEIHEAARRGRFEMSLTMHAVVAVRA